MSKWIVRCTKPDEVLDISVDAESAEDAQAQVRDHQRIFCGGAPEAWLNDPLNGATVGDARPADDA